MAGVYQPPSFRDAHMGAPAPVSPEAMTAPTFNPPATPPQMAAPAMPSAPSFQAPQMAAPPQNRGRDAAMLISAMLAGIKDPNMLGAALRGLQAGKDAKLAALENEQQRAERKAREGAEFYARAQEAAGQFDDEIAFENWRRAIAPSADLYGITPESFVFNASKKTAKDRKLIQDAIEAAMRRHGPDVLNRDDVSVQLADGRTVSMATARSMMGGEVSLTAGGRVPVPPKKAEEIADPNAPANTDYSRFLARWAASKGKKLSELTSADEVQARKAFGQADDRPPSSSGGPSDYQSFNMSERLAKTWQTSNAPVREMDRQIRVMRVGMDRFRKGDRVGGSQAIIQTFNKILDPVSVVREGEYARTSAGQSWIDRIEALYDTAKNGGANVSPEVMQELVTTAEGFLGAMADWNKGTRQRIETQAKKHNIDLGLVFDDALTGAPADGPSPTAPPTLRFNPATGKVEPIK